MPFEMSYEILTAAIFAVFAIFFALKLNGLNRLFLAALALWPFAMVASDHTTFAPYIPHLIAGVIFFVVIFYFHLKGHAGGGVAKGAGIIALWIPTKYLMSVFVSVTMGCSAAILLIALFRRKFDGDSQFEHYATLMFAISAAVLLFHTPL